MAHENLHVVFLTIGKQIAQCLWLVLYKLLRRVSRIIHQHRIQWKRIAWAWKSRLLWLLWPSTHRTGKDIGTGSQLFTWMTGVVVFEARFTAVARNRHDVPRWNLCIGQQRDGSRSDTVIGIHFRQACQFFHHSSKFVYPQRSVFVPDVLVLLRISFWILEECITFRIEFLKVHLEACEAVKKLVIWCWIHPSFLLHAV